MAPTPSNYDEQPEPGDLIEIFSGFFYQHWAVYVGDGYIVHLTSTSNVRRASANTLRSVWKKKGIVKKEELRDVVGTNRWKINNRLDRKYRPHSVQDIVSEAYAMVGEELRYSIFRRNCEHFANELRYGESESRQAQTGGAGLMGAVVVVGGAALAGILYEERENKKKQETSEA